MKEIFKVFGVDPRCMRRIINVFKVLKVIWKRSGGKFEVHDDLEQATLFLMLLASNESTRHVTYQIFDWMERGAVTYHRVVLEGEDAAQQNENNLANLFTTKLLKWDKSFELSFSNQKPKQGTMTAYIERSIWRDTNGTVSRVGMKSLPNSC